MQITRAEMLHISELANLNLNEEEMEKYVGDLNQILNYVEKIKNVDTSNIDEEMLLNENCNTFRTDEIERFEDTELLMQNVPCDNMFRIPKENKI